MRPLQAQVPDELSQEVSFGHAHLHPPLDSSSQIVLPTLRPHPPTLPPPIFGRASWETYCIDREACTERLMKPAEGRKKRQAGEYAAMARDQASLIAVLSLPKKQKAGN